MKLTLLLAAAGLAVFLFCLRFVDPAPPRRIVMATGMQGGAYQEFGEKYRDFLAKDGITLELRQTSGSLENVQLLNDKQADLAFVQTGAVDPAAYPELQSLASLGFEPLWIFCRDEGVKRLADLRGKRLAIGQAQSGTRALVRRLLADNGMDDPALNQETGGQAAADALRQGAVDAAFFVASLKAPLIQTLLDDPSVRLLSLDRIQAYPPRYPFLSGLELPQGVVNLARDLPRENVHLISPVITMVTREDFHPAVGRLLLRAAGQIHGGRGVFEEAGQFPSANFVEFPLSDDSRHFLKNGPSFLSRKLPFRVATSIERLSYLILPLLTLLIPLLRMAPPIYVWRVRRQIYRWYEKLVGLDRQLRASQTPGAGEPGSDSDKIRKQLARLDSEVSRVKVPLSYMDELFRLRSHIQMVLKGDALPVPAADGNDAAAGKAA